MNSEPFPKERLVFHHFSGPSQVSRCLYISCLVICCTPVPVTFHYLPSTTHSFAILLHTSIAAELFSSNRATELLTVCLMVGFLTDSGPEILRSCGHVRLENKFFPGLVVMAVSIKRSNFQLTGLILDGQT